MLIKKRCKQHNLNAKKNETKCKGVSVMFMLGHVRLQFKITKNDKTKKNLVNFFLRFRDSDGPYSKFCTPHSTH